MSHDRVTFERIFHGAIKGHFHRTNTKRTVRFDKNRNPRVSIKRCTSPTRSIIWMVLIRNEWFCNMLRNMWLYSRPPRSSPFGAGVGYSWRRWDFGGRTCAITVRRRVTRGAGLHGKTTSVPIIPYTCAKGAIFCAFLSHRCRTKSLEMRRNVSIFTPTNRNSQLKSK